MNDYKKSAACQPALDPGALAGETGLRSRESRMPPSRPLRKRRRRREEGRRELHRDGEKEKAAAAAASSSFRLCLFVSNSSRTPSLTRPTGLGIEQIGVSRLGLFRFVGPAAAAFCGTRTLTCRTKPLLHFYPLYSSVSCV